MAAQKTVSVLAKRMGNRLVKAHAESKDKPPEINAGLPAGINDGVAQLRGIGFGEYKSGPNKGEAYFMAHGVVVKPVIFNGRKIDGLRTQIGPIALCDTGKDDFKKSFEENYNKALDQLKILGVNTAEAEAQDTPEEVENYLLAAMQELTESKPYFSFETWQGKPTKDFPNPQVNHKWTGAMDYQPDAGIDPAMNGIHETSDNGQQTAQDAPTSEPASEIDIAALVELASQDEDGKSEKEVEEIISAQEKLNELAIASGKSKKEVAAAQDWQEVADMIVLDSDQPAEDEPKEKEEPKETGPVVGKVVKFPIRDPKKKKDVLKDCEVMTVDAKKKTVTLKNIDTDEVLKGTDKKPLAVPFDQLK